MSEAMAERGSPDKPTIRASCPRISVPPWRTARTAKQIAMEMGSKVELGESSQASSSTSGRRWFESDLFGVAWVLTAGLAVLTPAGPPAREFTVTPASGTAPSGQSRGRRCRGVSCTPGIFRFGTPTTPWECRSPSIFSRLHSACRTSSVTWSQCTWRTRPTHLHHRRGRNRGVRVRTSVGAWGDRLCFRRHRLRTRRSILGVLGIVGLLGHVLDRMGFRRRPAHHSCRHRVRWIVVFAVVLALAIYGGQPEIVLEMLLALASFLLVLVGAPALRQGRAEIHASAGGGRGPGDSCRIRPRGSAAPAGTTAGRPLHASGRPVPPGKIRHSAASSTSLRTALIF